MRCRYCRDRGGIFRRVCATCARVVAVLEAAGGRVGWSGLVDRCAAAGLTRAVVERVLDAAPDGGATMRDRLTAEMANALMRGLGMPGRQSAADVRRVRMEAGAGEGVVVAGGKPPDAV